MEHAVMVFLVGAILGFGVGGALGTIVMHRWWVRRLVQPEKIPLPTRTSRLARAVRRA